jgi:hypothetical protein
MPTLLPLVFALAVAGACASKTGAVAPPPTFKPHDDESAKKALPRLAKVNAQVYRNNRVFGCPVWGVYLDRRDASPRDAAVAAAFPRLRCLTISGVPAVLAADVPGEQILPHLRGLVRLEELVLRGVAVSDKDMADLAGFPELRLLGLHGGGTDAGLVHLRKLSKLDDLRFTNMTIKGEGLKHLLTLKKLRRLSLDWGRFTPRPSATWTTIRGCTG